MVEQASQLIVVENVSKHYGDVTAVSQLSMHINKGEIVSLLGPNGAGKTSLISLLLGQRKADAGFISINGQQPGHISARQSVGAILQSTELPGALKVREHIELFSQYYLDPYPLNDLLSLCGLTELTERRFETLSAGQKQRLYFALAVCGRPDTVFLDEPTVGLDAQSRREFWQCMRNLAQSGTSILLTTHYLDEIEALSDRVYLMHQGQITHEGTPESLKRQLGGKKIRFKTTDSLHHFSELPEVSQVEQIGDYLQLHSLAAEITLKALFQHGLTIQDISVLQASLEDAYIGLTQQNQQDATEQ